LFLNDPKRQLQKEADPMATLFNGDQLRLKPDPKLDPEQDAEPVKAVPVQNSVLDLLQEEADLRLAKVQTLRKARLAMQAKAAAEAEPAAPKKRRAKPPKFANQS
jgi:TfoX/Sxy family transcriptional regulator of competence genes